MAEHGRMTAWVAAWLAGLAGGPFPRWPRPSPAALAVLLTMAAALLATAVLALAAPAAHAECTAAVHVDRLEGLSKGTTSGTN